MVNSYYKFTQFLIFCQASCTNKFYMFDINLQCIIQRKVGDIRPKGIQNSYFPFFFCELSEGWKKLKI